jgi:predicted MFS family arabinose efflux permease
MTAVAAHRSAVGPRRPEPAPAAAGSPVLVLVVLALSTFAVTTMQSMVMPVLGDLAASLDVSQTTVAWVLTVSQLSAAVFTPLIASLGDALGRKRVLLATLALVTVGSVLVAVSTSFGVVLVGRVLQGLGFAAMPLAIGIVRSVFPPAKVASGLSILAGITGIGLGAGLVVAGLLVKGGLTGQQMFWIAGAVTLLGLVGTAVLVRLPEGGGRIRIDWWGLLTLSGGLVCLLLGINRGPTAGWASPTVLGLFAGAAVLLAAWVWVERRVAEPLVDLSLLGRPLVLGVNLTAFLTGAGMFGAFVLVVQYVQTPSRVGYGFDGDALSAGLTLAPMTAGTLLAAAAVATLIRWFGPKVPLVVGTAIAALTFVSLLLWHTEHWHFYVASGLLGLGLGMGMGAIPSLLNTAVAPEQTSIANGVNATLRMIGGAIGTTMTTAVLASSTLPGTPLPTLDAYTTAFWLSLAIGGVAVVASLVVPYRHAARRAAETAPAAAAAAAAAVPVVGSWAVGGTVRSAAGGVVPGATATLMDDRGRQVGRTTTGADGGYAVPLGGAGTFLLVVAAAGCAPVADTVVVADRPTRRDVLLPDPPDSP